jgi:excisionase family DNA binding protein
MKNTNDGVTVEPMLLYTREAARKLGICEKTLWTLTQDGSIPCVRIGRLVKYDPHDLGKWIESLKRTAKPNEG